MDTEEELADEMRMAKLAIKEMKLSGYRVIPGDRLILHPQHKKVVAGALRVKGHLLFLVQEGEGRWRINGTGAIPEKGEGSYLCLEEALMHLKNRGTKS